MADVDKHAGQMGPKKLYETISYVDGRKRAIDMRNAADRILANAIVRHEKAIERSRAIIAEAERHFVMIANWFAAHENCGAIRPKTIDASYPWLRGRTAINQKAYKIAQMERAQAKIIVADNVLRLAHERHAAKLLRVERALAWDPSRPAKRKAKLSRTNVEIGASFESQKPPVEPLALTGAADGVKL